VPTRNQLIGLIALGFSLFFLGACNPNPQPEGLTPVPTLGQAGTIKLVDALQGPTPAIGTPVAVVPGQVDAAIGAAIYIKNCSPCHGVQGQGVDAPALRNNQFIQTGGDQKIFETIANGRADTEMPAWLQTGGGPLTDAEISSIIDYLKTLQGLSSLPTSTPMPMSPTETPLPPNAPTPEPAQPSLPGAPGPAASLSGDTARGQLVFGSNCAACHGPEGVQGIPNPGSDDGSVPVLNPIDSTIANSDPKVFAANVDLFVEHGSVPSGPGPQIMMPPFGDQKLLTDQQIADVIAYVMRLNSSK
jgi:mono/diheme cytochrome c family protein